MLISKFFLVLVSVELLLLMQAESHISIDIDPEDMDGVRSFFESLLFNRPIQILQPMMNRRRSGPIKRLMAKSLNSVIQMFTIIITLVGANLITNKLSQPSHANFDQNLITTNTTAINGTNVCSTEFGCNRNLCWRACTVNNENDLAYTSWCFTSADNNGIVHQCKTHTDCSGCWECTHPCVKKGLLFYF